MKVRVVASLLILLAALPLHAGLIKTKTKTRDESLILYGQRHITLAVPEGYVYSSHKDERGLITARIHDPKEKISLQLSFVPDPAGECATARGRKEVMAETFQRYVAGSVEKAMRFEELEPRSGGGTYCVFTDAALVGETKLPPGEYLHSTSGIKAWRGYFAVFTLLSQDTTSAEYTAIMRLLREGLAEQPLTPLR
jgi:hypothetical protein